MASILIGTALSGMASHFGMGAIVSSIAYGVGSYAGSHIDNKLLASKPSSMHVNKLDNLLLQTSTYGEAISILYGQNRLAGNVIWATPITEHVNSNSRAVRVGKGGGRKVKTKETHYNYTIDLAISLGRGPINNLKRIWADTKILDLTKINYRFYSGDEEQLPDPLIESIYGPGKSPAYRGISYIIIEQFDLTAYGNRVPNFTFEIDNSSIINHSNPNILENKIKSMVLIPACGEFVYSTDIIYKNSVHKLGDQLVAHGKAMPININNQDAQPDAILAAKQLKESCRNLEWVALTVSWFANDVNVENIIIEPKTEHKNVITFPKQWRVADYDRMNATEVSKDNENYPIFGGTPSDQSVIDYIEHLTEKNLKISFYPLLQIDHPSKPWRGHISGDGKKLAKFCQQYQKYILHYANLLKGKLNAFMIGSEMCGLTKIKDKDYNYPFIDFLCELAAKVKQILGAEVVVTYGADWGEYHHDMEGYFYLDKLWADPNIDVIAIDAYFPLTTPNKQDIYQAWQSGEGYDYYWENGEQKPLDPEYAWKNIRYFWENYHYNPDGKVTDWKPKMKPIWFTEFGFPSVDGAANQPNKFYDPLSFDGGLPANSNGQINFEQQRKSLE